MYSTVVVYSDKVAPSCWTNNPCQYNSDKFPLACRDKSGNSEPAGRLRLPALPLARSLLAGGSQLAPPPLAVVSVCG